MAIKTYRPTSPARRGMTSRDFAKLTTNKPLRSLTVVKTRGNGRNNQGRITTRHKGGGSKRFYRLVNFKLPDGLKAVVEHIEYDPNRSAYIARIKDDSGRYHYVLADQAMKPGRKLQVGEEAAISPGNRLPLKNIPAGSQIYAVELRPGGRAQLVRSAGASAQLMGLDGGYAQVRLPSGEVRLIHQNARASMGAVGNEQHQNVKLGNAGRNRRLGKRPTVRGVVMNAVDHPHGGGDGGKHGIGGNPKTPWGQPTLGYKTRRRKSTTKYIVRRRQASKRR